MEDHSTTAGKATLFCQCRICDSEIAKTAITCPKCGHPVVRDRVFQFTTDVASKCMKPFRPLFKSAFMRQWLIVTICVTAFAVVLFFVLALFSWIDFNIEGFCNVLGGVFVFYGLFCLRLFYEWIKNRKPNAWFRAQFCQSCQHPAEMAFVEQVALVLAQGIRVSHDDIERLRSSFPGVQTNAKTVKKVAEEVVGLARQMTKSDDLLTGAFPVMGMAILAHEHFAYARKTAIIEQQGIKITWPDQQMQREPGKPSLGQSPNFIDATSRTTRPSPEPTPSSSTPLETPTRPHV